jgi:hypothetical protein
MDSGDGLDESRSRATQRYQAEALLLCAADVMDRLAWTRFVLSRTLLWTSELRGSHTVGVLADRMREGAAQSVASAWWLRMRAEDVLH